MLLVREHGVAQTRESTAPYDDLTANALKERQRLHWRLSQTSLESSAHLG